MSLPIKPSKPSNFYEHPERYEPLIGLIAAIIGFMAAAIPLVILIYHFANNARN